MRRKRFRSINAASRTESALHDRWVIEDKKCSKATQLSERAAPVRTDCVPPSTFCTYSRSLYATFSCSKESQRLDVA